MSLHSFQQFRDIVDRKLASKKASCLNANAFGDSFSVSLLVRLLAQVADQTRSSLQVCLVLAGSRMEKRRGRWRRRRFWRCS